MELKVIKDLLEKYYDGATSIEEEQIIKEYFLENDVPPELSVDKELFCSLSQEGEVGLINPDLEKKITGILYKYETQEKKQRF